MQPAVGFMLIYAAKLEPSQGYSFILGLLRYQTGSQAPRAVMPAVLQCTMAAAHAAACHGSAEAPSQWHEAVIAELKRLLSAAQECSSLALSIQTGENCTLLCPILHEFSHWQNGFCLQTCVTDYAMSRNMMSHHHICACTQNSI